ncbi:unnamed protein product [Linum trigynum]|uniref:Uncharacterized protein n=1 Tax=Linum trigynum TaxID=586398 RepID=A0AAV2GAL2_9ROSI
MSSPFQLSLPWLVVRDFNQIISFDEKRGGNIDGEVAIQDFANVLAEVGLEDLGYVGYPYTWDNETDGSRTIEEHLDQAVSNYDRAQAFPNTLVR